MNSVHTAPGVDMSFEVNELGNTFFISADLFCIVVMLFRVYQAFRQFGHYSKWRDELSVTCCEDEGTDASTLFALKALMQASPYPALGGLLGISSFILGVALRCFERPKNDADGFDEDGIPNGQDFSTVQNGIWCVIITMTTVGYGDFFAQTIGGRCVSLLIIFWGIFLVSMMVVTLTNTITLDVKETRAYNVQFRLSEREVIQYYASYVIVYTVRIVGLDKDWDRRKESPKFTKQQIKDFYMEYEEERAELKSKLGIYQGKISILIQRFIHEQGKILESGRF